MTSVKALKETSWSCR